MMSATQPTRSENMNSPVIWDASKEVLSSGLGFRVSRTVRTGLLDGFAIGALISGFCLLVMTSQRRNAPPARSLFAWRRRRPAPRHAAPPGLPGWVAALLPGREMARH
jgi:hypothetical protein